MRLVGIRHLRPTATPKPRRKNPNPPNPQARIQACRFLVEYLARGTKSSKDVIQVAKARGISLASLRRAKAVLGVEIEPIPQKDHASQFAN